MGSTQQPLTVQRLLLAVLAGVMALSAFFLWKLRTGPERARGIATEAPAGSAAVLPGELVPPAPGTEAVPAPRPAPPPARTALHSAPEPSAPSSGGAFDPGAILGRVVHRARALEGVELFLFSAALERRERGAPLADTRSDAEGRFRFAGLTPHARYGVVLQHPEFLPSEATLHPGHEEELELEPAATVRGTVRAAASGAPLAGVELALERWHVAPSGTRALVAARSDAEGRWQLGWAEPGMQRLLVLRPGFLPEAREFQVAVGGGDGYEIWLDEGPALELELYALESGELLADTEVQSDDVTLRTDARGRLALPRATPAEDSVRVSLALAGGCLTQGRIELAAAPGAGPVVRVPLARGATVTGRVLDALDAPVDGARVRLSGGGRLPAGLTLPPGFWLNAPRGGGRSGPDGRFVLAGLAPRADPIQVHVQHAEFPPALSEPFELAQLGATVEVEVRLDPGATITGHVRLDGEPAALLVYWNGERAGGWTRADDRGAYRITGVPAGEISLRPRLDDEDEDLPRREDRALVVAGGERLTADFDLTGDRAWIRGRVLDARGAPVVGAEVFATLDPGEEGGDELLGDEPRDESGPDGTFALSVPAQATGVYAVQAHSGPRSAVVEGVRAGAARLELVLAALTPVTLRVVDALRHEPVLGFTLYWRESESGSFARLVQGGRRFSPGPDGTFLAELPAGRLDLVASARNQGYVPARRDGLDLLGASPPPVEFVLELGVTLELQVTSEAPGGLQPLQRGRTAIASEAQWADRERGGDFFQQEVRNAQALRMDANGVARVEALASGSYRFFNVPKGFVFRPQTFALPPVAEHRVSVRLEPKPPRKPDQRGD